MIAMTVTGPSRAFQLPLQTSEMAGVFNPDRSWLLSSHEAVRCKERLGGLLKYYQKQAA